MSWVSARAQQIPHPESIPGTHAKRLQYISHLTAGPGSKPRKHFEEDNNKSPCKAGLHLLNLNIYWAAGLVELQFNYKQVKCVTVPFSKQHFLSSWLCKHACWGSGRLRSRWCNRGRVYLYTIQILNLCKWHLVVSCILRQRMWSNVPPVSAKIRPVDWFPLRLSVDNSKKKKRLQKKKMICLLYSWPIWGT